MSGYICENVFSDFGDDHITFLVKRFKAVLVSAGVAIYEVEPQWTLLKDLMYRK